MAKLINGKEISQQIKDELKEKVSALKAQGKNICLAVIQVGNDPASSVYVGNKKKACAYIGIESRAFELPEETTEEELLSIIKDLNEDDGDLSEEGCGWIPSGERWQPVYWQTGIRIMYTSGNYPASEAFGD